MASKKLLQSILSDVHRSFIYRSDLETAGQVEYWESEKEVLKGLDQGRDGFEGDCDSFALACRAKLRKENIPNRLVFCVAEGVGHLVCEVEGYILDNRHKWLMKQNEMPYTWVSISGYQSGDPWHEIK